MSMAGGDLPFTGIQLSEVEELNSRDITEEELKEFIRTEPFQVRKVSTIERVRSGTSTSTSVASKRRQSISQNVEPNEQCGLLITRYIDGELDFPDIYAKLVSDADEEDEGELEIRPIDVEDSGSIHNLTEIGTERIDDDTLRSKDLEEYEQNQEEVEAEAEAEEKDEEIASKAVAGSSKRKQRRTADGNGSIENFYTRRRKRKCKPTTRNPLDSTMQCVMGQANLMFVRGNYEMAEKLCLEVIRQNPQVADPFFTLAEMYEAKDPEKALKFLTLAVHLDPTDCDQWKRITESHTQRGDLKKARVLYSRAIRFHPRDFELRHRKSELLKEMGESNLAMVTCLKMLPLIPPEHANLCIQTMHSVVKYYEYIGKNHLTLEAWEGAFSACGDYFEMDDFLKMMRFLVKMERFGKVLKYLVRQKWIQLESKSNEISEANIYYYNMREDICAELRTMGFIALIGLKNFNLVGKIIRDMHDNLNFIKENLDYYQNIGEILFKYELYDYVLRLLKPFVDNHFVESPTTLLLQYAQSLYKLKRINETLEMFTKIVEIAPLCYDARFTLAAILKQLGRELEAAKVLKPPEDSRRPIHTRLLYERCFMLLNVNEINEALEIGCTLLGRYSIKMRNRQELLAAASGCSAYNAEGLKVILEMRNIIGVEAEEVLNPDKNLNPHDNLSLEDEYKLFRALYSTASKYRKYSVLERLCFTMVTTKRFSPYSKELERIMVLACLFNNDCSIAFNFLRELIHKDVRHMGLWNLLALLVQKGHDLRYHRYIVRLLARHDVTPDVKILIAHYHLHSNSFKYALNAYAPLVKTQKSPIAALCMAVVFNQIALQKKILRKCAAISQSVAFIQKYSVLRAGCDINQEEFRNCSAAAQEINYNIGRIYHQVGIMHLAIFYYERALSCHHPLITEHSHLLDLTPEIAFNLHLIYKASGNIAKARQYLYDYCVV